MPIDLLEVGKIYYYKETSAPQIDDISDELHEFSLNEDGTLTISKVENIRKNKTIKLTKTDLLGGQKIPNCKFVLRSLETDYSVEGTTDENGEYVLDADGNPIVKDASGYKAIIQKFNILKEYFANTWGMDITKLREVILRRTAEVKAMDLETLK